MVGFSDNFLRRRHTNASLNGVVNTSSLKDELTMIRSHPHVKTSLVVLTRQEDLSRSMQQVASLLGPSIIGGQNDQIGATTSLLKGRA